MLILYQLKYDNDLYTQEKFYLPQVTSFNYLIHHLLSQLTSLCFIDPCCLVFGSI